jgi:Mn2+/Fe2+ NRAMP family transporter
MPLKEIIVLIVVSLSSLFILGYSIHMFIGGMVSETTERWSIIIACAVGAIIVGLLVADIFRQRRQR